MTSGPRSRQASMNLAGEMAKRRGKRYPAHARIAEKFPGYVKALVELDEVIRLKPRRFNQKMHELFHIRQHFFLCPLAQPLPG